MPVMRVMRVMCVARSGASRPRYAGRTGLRVRATVLSLSDFDHKRPRYVRVGQKKASVEARAGTASASTSTGGDGVYSLTAGDLARLLGVDLKTIHNWVNQR